MRKICLTLLGCLCLLTQGYCNDRDDVYFDIEELFLDAIREGNIASCKTFLETEEISKDTLNMGLLCALFENPEYPDERSISTRIELGQLLAKYLPPDTDSWLQYWASTTTALPLMDPEIWKIITSSVTPQNPWYPKLFLFNCIVRKQCYETYSDYSQFLKQLHEDYDAQVEESELTSFLPGEETLQAYIDFCKVNNVSFSSKEEISEFVEQTYIPKSGIFSGFIPLLDDELGLILHPTTKTNLLMDFFLHDSLESSLLQIYSMELPLLYFTNRFFEKKPLCQLDPKIVVERILEGFSYDELGKRKFLYAWELRIIYARYRLLMAPEVQDYIQQLPNSDKNKVELILNLAKKEGCDRDSLLSLVIQKLDMSIHGCFENFRDHLHLFNGGTIDRFSFEENKFSFTLTSHELSEDEAEEIFDNRSKNDVIEYYIRFLKVEDLKFDEEDNGLKMIISDLSFDEDHQMTIHYFVDKDPTPHLLKVKAKKILCHLQ